MTTTASNAWMPTGRHEVTIGPSLARALKARNSAPVKSTLSRQKPDREFYSFRYNFKPESVDSTKPGTIEVKAKEEGPGSSVTVVRPSTQKDQGVSYVGTENPAKEFECVLVWDDVLGTITLEKIESNVALTHDHKRVHVPRHVGSPGPVAPPRMSASSSASSSHALREPIPRHEEEESEGEIPDTKQSTRPTTVPAQSSKLKPPVQAPAPILTSAPQPMSRGTHGLPPKPAHTTVQPQPKGSAQPAAAPTKVSAAVKPRPKVTNNNKRPLPAHIEEETIEIRRPVQQPPPKKPKMAAEKKAAPPPPPPPKLVALSFPDQSSLVSLPPPLPSAAAAAPSPPLPTTAPVTTVLSDSEEDDEWDEVPPPIAPIAPTMTTLPLPAATLPTRTIVMVEIEPEPSAFTPPPHAASLPPPLPLAEEIESEDLDMALQAELDGELADPDPDPAAEPDGIFEEDDDDFLAGAVSPVTERQPQSMSEYAGTVVDFFGDEDDDEYSSSDDSDDD